MELDRSELKRLMRQYFHTTGRLLFWQRDAQMMQLETKILELLLETCEKAEYLPACQQVLEDTASLRTEADCAVLKLTDDLVDRELTSFYDMKSDALKRYKIRETQAFDMDILLMDNRQAVIDGDPGALALGAWLCWLGLDNEFTPETALRYWTVLAYTGERMAMRALVYAYHSRRDQEKAKLWEQIYQICREADQLFTITVPEHFLQDALEEAVNTAQVIMAVRRCCVDDGKELLPIPMLLYAIDSPEDVPSKLQKLYAPPETFHTMLTRESRREKKPMGFRF